MAVQYFIDGQLTDVSLCRGCGSSVALRPVVLLESCPINCSAVLRSREAALNITRGNVQLAFCELCGLISDSSEEIVGGFRLGQLAK